MGKNLVLYVVSCQGEEKHSLVLDVEDQNTTYVFTSKVTRVGHLNSNITTIKVFNVHLKNELIFVMVTFEIIDSKWTICSSIASFMHGEVQSRLLRPLRIKFR
jgi:hypothetical protein